MIKGSKICGISDLDTLNFIINHPYPPQFIGFICNYKKSSRYVEVEKLNELLKLDKKKSNFVAVLVKPNEDILEKIKHLPFDYYQIYDCTAPGGQRRAEAGRAAGRRGIFEVFRLRSGNSARVGLRRAWFERLGLGRALGHGAERSRVPPPVGRTDRPHALCRAHAAAANGGCSCTAAAASSRVSSIRGGAAETC